jgi:hypothetical protein
MTGAAKSGSSVGASYFCGHGFLELRIVEHLQSLAALMLLRII